jgi:transposase-like protein
MENTAFQALLAMIDDFTDEQRRAIKKALEGDDSFEKVVMILSGRLLGDRKCLHCGSNSVKKWGMQSGLQRFRCAECGKSFNVLTGTPLAHLRKKESWLDMAFALREGLSVRKTAERCGICVSTAFRWRHRFLTAIRQDTPEKLEGIAEADETYFLESFKGQRKLSRSPRRRGGKAKSPGLSREQIPVLIARDRVGSIVDGVLLDQSSASIKLVLGNKVSKDNILCIDGGNALWGFVNAGDIPCKVIPPGKHLHERNPIFHIQNVNAYHHRLKGWMMRFNGVATKYLPNYLGWRRMFENPNRVLTPTAWVQAASGRVCQ